MNELSLTIVMTIIKSSDPDASYTISNISLKFDTVTNASLASQIRTEYMKSNILYDRILRSRVIPLNNFNTSFSVDINSPSKSLKGVLLIFTKERSATKGRTITFYGGGGYLFRKKNCSQAVVG